MGGSGTAESARRDPCPPRLDTLYFREVPIKSQPSATKGVRGHKSTWLRDRRSRAEKEALQGCDSSSRTIWKRLT